MFTAFFSSLTEPRLLWGFFVFVLCPSGSLKYAFVLDRCHAAKSAAIIGGGGEMYPQKICYVMQNPLYEGTIRVFTS